MLNPTLNREQLKQDFAKQKRLIIEDFLAPGIAERVAENASRHLLFKVSYSIDGKNHSISQAEMNALSNDEKRELNTKILDAASQGVGFLYCAYRPEDIKDTSSEELIFLHDFFDFIRSEEVLSLIQYITGNEKIDRADAHYTRYTPGQFLTRHQDIIPGKNRRFAYVLGFTPSWHPDWGGLLQFYLQDGSPEETWVPKFNALSLFDTKYIHAVTCVAPYAGDQRLSLTGWFREPPGPETPSSNWSVSYKL